ncbi:MAG TPA: 6-phosphogluconolactonase [archaeon]|nr:6-phosphogluconolactonase [archaeon]
MSKRTADFIESEIKNSKKQFSIAFPGGTSVHGIFKELSIRKISWQMVNVFLSDERFVPITSPESNYKQAQEMLFSKVDGIHVNPFEIEKGISDYNEKFMQITKGEFDIVILGVGEDGHIASLFPNMEVIKSKARGYIQVHNAPKPPAERISLSPNAIENAKTVILLFASENKKAAYEKFMDKKVSESECPAKIALKAKRTIVFSVFGGLDAK